MAIFRDSLTSEVLSPKLMGTSGILVLLVYLYMYWNRGSKLEKGIPVLGSFDTLYETMLSAGIHSKTKPFKIPENPNKSATPTLVLPRKYLNEIKSLPSDVASFEDFVAYFFAGDYTGLGEIGHPLISAIKIDLTRNITYTMDILRDEADFCIPRIIGLCEDWTEVPLYPSIARIVAQMSSSTFVGLPLCRDDRWLDSMVNFTGDALKALTPVKSIHPMLRPFLAPRLDEIKGIKRHLANGGDLLKDILKQRLEMMKDPVFEPPKDMIQFVINNSSKAEGESAYAQSVLQMRLSFAAIMTTSLNIAHVMFDLCAHPEYIPILREEIQEVFGPNQGRLEKTTLTKLKKMDSFVKESQRHNPPGMGSMNRKVLKDITLHDGFVLPAGTLTTFSALEINFDPELYPDPFKFDGLRFAKLREKPENALKYQLVTTGLDAISFGHGVHACPGRFFASNEIKIILTNIILNYDFGLKKGGGTGERPKNVHDSTRIRPNTTARVWFKRRSAV